MLAPARRFILSLSLAIVYLLSIATTQPIWAQSEAASDEVIIKYKSSTSLNERLHLRDEIRAQIFASIPELRVEVARIDSELRQRLLQRLRYDPRIEYVEPNYKAQALLVPNDPLLSNQWGLFTIKAADNAQSAWNLSQGSSSVEIAILDTGIDEAHPDLRDKISRSQNFTNSPTVQDVFGHGTHVAGIAAAATNNGQGIAGVAYQVKLANLKVLDDNGSGYYSWIASGLIWAADQRIPVVNMSLGGSSSSLLLSDAVTYATNKGTLLVGAAGNSGKNTYTYPAAFDQVIAVAATDKNDNKASFSNYGTWVDIAAPGVAIYSTLPTYPNKVSSLRSYGYLNGTSMATPFVAGTAALLFGSGNTSSEVRNYLEDYADRINGTGIYFLHGRVNSYRSLQALQSEKLVPTPSLTTSPTPTNSPIPTAQPTTTTTPTKTPTPTIAFTPTPTRTLPWWCYRWPQFCR